MSKTKIVETFTGQSVSDFGTKLRNCAKVLRMETLGPMKVVFIDALYFFKTSF